MAAVLVFLIGSMTAGALPVDDDAPSAPGTSVVANATPEQRRDDETVSGMRYDELTIQRRIIVRIPMLPHSPLPAPEIADNGKARKKPTCVALRSIRGASITDKAGLVFVTAANGRYHATLERGCRPIDFQSGFYLDPSADGSICVGRDILHARNGAGCMITSFASASGGN